MAVISVQALDAPYSATQRFLVTGGTVGDTITAAIDTSIATVDYASQVQTVGGVTFTVTGVGAGACTLTITDTSTVPIEAIPWTINVTGLPQGPTTVTVGVGQTVSLTYSELNDPAAFTITGPNTAYATMTTVSNAEGSATINITGVSNGSTSVVVDDGHGNTLTTTITVAAEQVPLLIQQTSAARLSGVLQATLSANPTIGNVVLAVLTGYSGTLTANTGWNIAATAAGSINGFNKAGNFALAWRKVVFGDTPTFEPFTSPNFQAGVKLYLFEYTGVDNTTPINCAALVNGTGLGGLRYVSALSSWDGTTYRTPQIIPNVVGCLEFYVLGIGGENQDQAPSTLQTPFDNVATFDSLVSGDGGSLWNGSGGPNYVIGPGASTAFAGASTQSVAAPSPSAFTLELVLTGPTTACTVFSSGYDGGTNGINIYTGGASNTFDVGVNGNVSVAPDVSLGGIGYGGGEFVHIVVTYDGATLTGYINGEPCSSKAIAAITLNGSGPTVIGGRAQWNGVSVAYSSYYTGNINKYAVYGSALTAQQIYKHYQSVMQMFWANLTSPTEDQYTKLYDDDFLTYTPGNKYVIAQASALTMDTTTPREADAKLSPTINPLSGGYDSSCAGLFFLTPAQPQPAPKPRQQSNMVKIVISKPTGEIVALYHRGLVGSQFVDEVNGGNTTATLVLPKKVVDTSWFSNLLGNDGGAPRHILATPVQDTGAPNATPPSAAPYNWRVQFWFADSIDPWWDGRIIDWDPEQQTGGAEFITLQCEGWHTYLANAIVTEDLNPGLQPNGINNGTMNADTYAAHLASTYVDSSIFGNGTPPQVAFIAPMPMSLDKMSFDGTELNRCIDQIVKNVEDNSGHTYEWWVRGTLSQGTSTTGHPAIVIQPNQVPNNTLGVGYGLVTGRIAPTDQPITYGYIFEFVNSTTYDYKVVNSSAGLYNMIALYGGKDPTTQQQVYGAYKDSTSISLYGLRQKKVTNQNLISQTSMTNFATAYLLLHAYAQPQGTYKTFIAHDSRRAGRWVQIFVPGDVEKNIGQTINQCRIIKVTTTIEDGERLVQEVHVTAPRPFIDHAVYNASASASIALAGSTTRLNTTMLTNYYVMQGGNVVGITNVAAGGTAQATLDTATGFFNQSSQSASSATGSTISLTDTATGATGDGHYEVSFCLNPNLVIGAGGASPAYIVSKIQQGGNPVFSPFVPTGMFNDSTVPVLKIASFTVVNGSIVGYKDLRVLGGIGTANLQNGVITITKIAPGTVSIANCSDVLLSGLSDGQFLQWNATAGKWENVSLPGDTDLLAALTDCNVSSETNNQALQWNGGTSKWVNKNLTITEEAALPTADAAHLGQILRVLGGGAGTPDKMYACRQRADGSYVWSRFQGRAIVLKLCSADFTPSGAGTDLGGLMIVPYDPDENSDISITWEVVKLLFRVETQGSTSTTLNIQRSTGTGNFVNAGNLLAADLTLAASSNEVTTRTFAQATVNSGDKLLPNYTALGTSAAGFTLILQLRES